MADLLRNLFTKTTFLAGTYTKNPTSQSSGVNFFLYTFGNYTRPLNYYHQYKYFKTLF